MPLFLENFTGTNGTALDGHTIDIAPAGVAWQPRPAASGMMLLDGHAISEDAGGGYQYGHNPTGAYDGNGAEIQLGLVLPYRITVVMKGSPPETTDVDYGPAFELNGSYHDDISFGSRLRIQIVRQGEVAVSHVQVVVDQLYPATTVSTSILLADPDIQHTIVVLFEADQFTLTVDGVAEDPVPCICYADGWEVKLEDLASNDGYFDSILIENEDAPAPPPAPDTTLPSILIPTSCYLLAGHGSQWQSVFADVAMTTGHMRKRRVVTSRPQIVNVAMVLERDEMTEFHVWFRDTLRRGERHFAARVKDQGAGFLWYDAAWVQMYQATAMHLGRWRVEGQLILTGTGQEAGPVLGSFRGEAVFALGGSGSLTVVKRLRGEAVFALEASRRLRGEAVFALES